MRFITLSAAMAAMIVLPFTQAATLAPMSIDERSLVKRQMLTGQATTYGGNTAGGACSFSTYTLPAGLYGTALSDSNWDNSGNCGGCISVTGPAGGPITAMVCPTRVHPLHPWPWHFLPSYFETMH